MKREEALRVCFTVGRHRPRNKNNIYKLQASSSLSASVHLTEKKKVEIIGPSNLYKIYDRNYYYRG